MTAPEALPGTEAAARDGAGGMFRRAWKRTIVRGQRLQVPRGGASKLLPGP